ncbi:IS66 family insertion sequence element accessory protein TnpB, partial [Caldibacillus thermoamylovorans]|uniref:IS66 family insertion sequence element accessory protein TnpB n=2 Tax=Caldibacillus TaxID=1276290 RepID=UPI000A8907EB
MRHDYSSVKNIYIICGKTDMRKGIDGLATLIQDSFELDPYGDSIFLFSGWSKDRYKCLYFDGDGFAMLYKRLDNGKLQWPRNEKEVRNLSQQELLVIRRIIHSAAKSYSTFSKRAILN